MVRGLIELLILIVFAIGARSILISAMRGLTGSVGNRPAAGPRPPVAPASGELHKDPICGTYVAGSTRFQRHSGSETFYYCSAECRERHGVRMAKVS